MFFLFQSYKFNIINKDGSNIVTVTFFCTYPTCTFYEWDESIGCSFDGGWDWIRRGDHEEGTSGDRIRV
jgi:hypothetical protein